METLEPTASSAAYSKEGLLQLQFLTQPRALGAIPGTEPLGTLVCSSATN